jgi:mono/diheme cytochrome c family protein
MRTTLVLVAVCLSLFAQTSRSVWDGVYTDDQAKRGRALYGDHCGSCHGASLEGGESAPALTGGEFLSNWNGLSAGDLFERIRSTMPQNKPRSLSREVNADILAYVFSANQFPPGKEELAHAAEILKEIRIEGTRPEKK